MTVVTDFKNWTVNEYADYWRYEVDIYIFTLIIIFTYNSEIYPRSVLLQQTAMIFQNSKDS